MITYLLKSGLLLAVFYAVYKLLLENERMFRFNRAYLLGSLIFSLVIPLQLFSIASFFPSKIKTIQLDEIMIVSSKSILSEVSYSEIVYFSLGVIYIFITAILLIRFAVNVSSFFVKMKKNSVEFIDNQKLVLMKESILPHSFWNAIFISKEDFANGRIPSELIAHEKAHLQQKHTLDILFVEVLQIVFWFNPMFVLFEKAIKLNHEFLADEAVNRQFDEVKSYQNLLLQFASNKHTVALASNINYQITKKRLIMMTKKESVAKAVFKVLAVGAISMILLFTFSSEAVAQDVNIVNNKVYKAGDSEIKQPEFPGGMLEFYKFVGQRFKISEEVSKNKIDTKIYMQFMVEKDGSLSEITIVKDAGYGLGEEAIRVLKLSPNWIPGSENGKPVRVLYSLPITIQTEK
ncbi:M56 family metallopeptidase [Flavobacterium sharifuzzamanii]|uniref:M56 family metallopeptidase n=1 Tax=Flavobacterium sharifuzzamanii TaxID=2211133 RepID=UPI000DAB4EDE|nr:M56 family metallopeptidase [Flavobacterium sharifuzzamanii]KAF2079451.1 M56 family peptidase [Flavobacterium sharifuzzamanii]